MESNCAEYSPVCWCPCRCGCQNDPNGGDIPFDDTGLCASCSVGQHEIPPGSLDKLIAATESFLRHLKSVQDDRSLCKMTRERGVAQWRAKFTRVSNERTIVAAAVRLPGNLIASVPRPGRHHDVVQRLAILGIKQAAEHEQGFLTNLGEFVRRKPARLIAQRANQLLPRASELLELYSEDVW